MIVSILKIKVVLMIRTVPFNPFMSDQRLHNTPAPQPSVGTAGNLDLRSRSFGKPMSWSNDSAARRFSRQVTDGFSTVVFQQTVEDEPARCREKKERQRDCTDN